MQIFPWPVFILISHSLVIPWLILGIHGETPKSFFFLVMIFKEFKEKVIIAEFYLIVDYIVVAVIDTATIWSSL